MANSGTAKPSETTRAPRSGLLLCCLLVVVLASYIPVLGAPFVWDDHHLVEESALVQQPHPLSAYFGQGFWQGDDVEPGRTYYRPLSILSLALDKQLYGDNSGGFHLTNLLCHVLSTSLLFSLLRARRVPPLPAILGAAVWALHPRLTEAVAWISGRTDVLAACFVLAALLVRERRSVAGSLGSALFLLLGLLCKEVALAGVVAVLVLELGSKAPLRERALRALPTLVALASYLTLRGNAIGLGGEHPTALGFGERLRAGSAALGHYVVMSAEPWFPNLQIGRLHRPDPLFLALGCVALVGAVFFLVRYRRRLGVELVSSLSLAAVGLGLVLHVIPVSIGVLAADRFLYVPMLGVVLAVTPIVATSARQTLFAAGAGALLVSFVVATFTRASAWSDEVALWTTTFVDTRADPSLAAVELGRVYARAGLLPNALALDAAGASPEFIGYPMAVNNAASVLARMGKYGDATASLTPLVAQFPGVPLFSLNLALFESYANRFDLAHADLARALTIYPDYPQGNALAERLAAMAQQRRELDALPAAAPILERARRSAKLGLASEALSAWLVAATAPTISRAAFEEGLWFALREGNSEAVEALYTEYAKRFAQHDERLVLVYETRAELIRRLRAAWPGLGVALPI